MENRGRAPGSPDFGMLLRQHRLAAALSQEALAERARMSTQGVSALERGYRRTPQRETLSLLAAALALNDEQREEFEAAAARSVLLGRGASVTVGPWADGPSTTLPLALTSFVGRETELDEIVALVREHRMVTLTGTGGIGKTQTALHAATTLCGSADVAVCFIGLAPIRDPALVATAIANALGVQQVPTHPLIETLAAFLKNKAMLLLLDNCEHLISEAGNAAGSLLAACPDLRILATSREPLRTGGEHRYRLPSLDEGNGIALFEDRARAADAHFVLTDTNRQIVSAICARLSGIPLAIELAAARVTALPPNALAKELENRLGILSGGDRAALPRQRTMHATVEWSYNLLAAAEQRVFERLSIFAGGCTLEAAIAVCASEDVRSDDVLDVITSLADKSLVVADLTANDPRYDLLEPFRQYASERLAARGERQVTAHHHARAFLELADRFRRRSQPGRAIITIPQDADNWSAALQWTLRECGDIVLGQHLACAAPLAVFEKGVWISRALELVDAATPASLVAELRLEQARMAAACFERETQLESSELAIVHYREAGDPLGVARAQTFAGLALESLGRADEGTSVLQMALTTARTLGDRFFVAYLLRVLAHALYVRGDVIAARCNVEEALRIYENLDAQAETAWALEDLAEIECCANQAQQALGHATEMLRIVRNLKHDPRLCARALSAMSLCLMWLDRFDEAANYAREALDLELEHGLPFLIGWSIHYLAAIAVFRTAVAGDDRQNARAQAARLLGFVDARVTSLRLTLSHADQLVHNRVIAALNDAFGMNAAAILTREGAKMSEDEAVENALAL
jgi:predicted ATPase/transcriptional regulator with XRE-family HTH domain